MAPKRSCKATNADGDPCGAPSNVVDPETGLCPAHSENGRERVREAARKGGRATARKRRASGVDPSLRLRTYSDVQKWLELVVQAVLSQSITHHQARAAIRGLEAWMKAYEGGEVTEKFDALADALEEWRETGNPEPVLELVK